MCWNMLRVWGDGDEESGDGERNTKRSTVLRRVIQNGVVYYMT